MKKQFILLTILCFFSLCACGKKERETYEKKNLSEFAEQTEIDDVSEQYEADSESVQSEKRDEETLQVHHFPSKEGLAFAEEISIGNGDYVVGLLAAETDSFYQLVLRVDDREEILKKDTDYSSAENCEVEIFEELMGLSGFSFQAETTPGLFSTYYYGIEEGVVRYLGYSWGFPDEQGIADYMKDIDQDGKNELICNVMYGDGARRVIIYRDSDDGVLEGNCDTLLDEEYDTSYYGNMYYSYLPDENLIEFFYLKENEDEFRSKKYEIAIDKIQWQLLQE